MATKRKSSVKTVIVRKATNAKNFLKRNENENIVIDKRTLVKEEIESRPITTLKEYIDVIEQNCFGDDILFRGQNCDWPLLPKLCRLQLRVDDILQTEKNMLDLFKRLSKPHLTKVPANNWEWIALAQHHGVPTRLLDWSTNPLAALWFAVSQPCRESNGVVWIFFLDRKLFISADQLMATDPLKEKKARVFQPEISTIRIQSQSGWFTTQEFNRRKQFLPINELREYSQCLLKLTIPQSAFSNLRFQLDRFGINRFSLFQDLDGIASYVEWMNTIGSDEMDMEKKWIPQYMNFRRRL